MFQFVDCFQNLFIMGFFFSSSVYSSKEISLVLHYFKSRTVSNGMKSQRLYVCRKNKLLLSKWQSKQILDVLRIKRICVLSIFILITILKVIKNDSRNSNGINFYPCDLLFFWCTVYCASNFLSLFVSPYEYDCTPLPERPTWTFLHFF